jgi:2-polyprenyl-6-methoxyphenol hydroxylase-like FAD-dependent oxidoreductase
VTRTQVAIIGGGPVGLTTSIALSERGVANHVLERHHDLFHLPRAIVMDAEIHRTLIALGLGEGLEPLLTPMTRADFVDGAGNELMGIDVGQIKLLGVPIVSCHYQPDLDQFLLNEARGRGADVRMGVAVVGHEELGDGVLLTLDDGSRIVAEYVVACDGANSETRRRLGISMFDLQFEQDWIVVDAEVSGSSRDRLPDATRQVCDPNRPTTLVRGHRHHYRWEFQVQSNESPSDLNTVDGVWGLLAPWVSRDDVRIIRHAAYRFRGVVAESMRSGRVLLAGDSAHQMPPFMGQGLNSGMRDAFNLSWKLALVLRGSVSSKLLDTYGTERIAHATSVVHHSVDTGRLIDQLAGRTTHGGDDSAGYGGSRPQPRLGPSVICDADDSAGAVWPRLHEIDQSFMAEGRFAVVVPTPLTAPIDFMGGSPVIAEGHRENRWILLRPDGYMATTQSDEGSLRSWIERAQRALV